MNAKEFARFGTLEAWKELGAFKIKSLMEHQMLDVTLTELGRSATG